MPHALPPLRFPTVSSTHACLPGHFFLPQPTFTTVLPCWVSPFSLHARTTPPCSLLSCGSHLVCLPVFLPATVTLPLPFFVRTFSHATPGTSTCFSTIRHFGSHHALCLVYHKHWTPGFSACCGCGFAIPGFVLLPHSTHAYSAPAVACTTACIRYACITTTCGLLLRTCTAHRKPPLVSIRAAPDSRACYRSFHRTCMRTHTRFCCNNSIPTFWFLPQYHLGLWFCYHHCLPCLCRGSHLRTRTKLLHTPYTPACFHTHPSFSQCHLLWFFWTHTTCTTGYFAGATFYCLSAFTPFAHLRFSPHSTVPNTCLLLPARVPLAFILWFLSTALLLVAIQPGGISFTRYRTLDHARFAYLLRTFAAVLRAHRACLLGLRAHFPLPFCVRSSPFGHHLSGVRTNASAPFFVRAYHLYSACQLTYTAFAILCFFFCVPVSLFGLYAPCTCAPAHAAQLRTPCDGAATPCAICCCAVYTFAFLVRACTF